MEETIASLRMLTTLESDARRRAEPSAPFQPKFFAGSSTMGELNSRVNRAVWFDIPVSDLDRAIRFYRAVLAVGVDKETFGSEAIGVIEHQDGNGGCLVPGENEADSR